MRTSHNADVEIGGVSLEMTKQGDGPPLLYLHGGYPQGRPSEAEPILLLLASSFTVFSPTHPGFGRVDPPDWMTTVDDLAYLYLDLLRHVGDALVVGASFGGWIAAEMAVKSTEQISRLVLVNPLGIKVGDREHRDLVDIYSVVDSELADLAFVNPGIGMPDPSALSDEDLFFLARSREATARYGWSPYLHNPKLRGRLSRINVPTLVLWGEDDRIADAEYGKSFADAISGAELIAIPSAGQFPMFEQPDISAQHIMEFAGFDARESP